MVCDGQVKFWFSMDELSTQINELKRQRARGAEIEDGHLAELDEIAGRLKRITRRYDTTPRS